ncbi:hypothetical protein BGX23_008413 [Mortierella sp. AD031]|nr:hypothetical protein BGX23_008413 [Mortierella sp. AD031]
MDRLRCRVQEVEWSPTDTSDLEPDYDYGNIESTIRFFRRLRSLSVISLGTRLPLALLMLLRDEGALATLRRLELNLQHFQQSGLVPIRQLFGRFKQLTELKLEGVWYRPETEDELAMSEQTKPWRLTSLSTPHTQLGFLRRCPDLRRLTLTAIHMTTTTSPIAAILSCTRLEELHFVGVMAFGVSDLGHVLGNMAVLTLLEIELWHQDLFGRLQVLLDNVNAPAFTKLQLVFLGATNRIFVTEQLELQPVHQELLLSIMRSRPDLQSFVLRGIAVAPFTFFEEEEEEEAEGQDWPATLKELVLEIIVTAELERLSLRSPHLEKNVNAGFPLLGGQSKILDLTLSNATRPIWTTEELHSLLRVAPNLRTLDLQPISEINRTEINTWLGTQGKHYLRF